MKMKQLLLMILFLVSLNSNGMLVNPFEGDPEKAKEYILERKSLQDWMINQTIMCNNLAVLKVYFEHGNLSPNLKIFNKETLLHVAATYGAFDVAHYLLVEKNVEVNAPDKNEETPLHCALYQQRNTPIIHLLLQHKADPLKPRPDGLTPLQMAKRFQYIEAVKLLEKHIEDSFISSNAHT
jgi:ankyrin repeat protein